MIKFINKELFNQFSKWIMVIEMMINLPKFLFPMRLIFPLIGYIFEKDPLIDILDNLN
jgi:patatin-like phospholipase/acyl hydrolase